MARSDDDTQQTMTIRGGTLRVSLPEPVGHFLVWNDNGTPRRVEIGPGGLSIGRTPPNDIVIPSPEVSRRHCRIEVAGDRASVTDLGSTNGTVVGGRRITGPAILRNGMRLLLGTVQMLYERRDPREVAEEAELASELRRAADYVRAILPDPVPTGPVQVDWCFVPCSQLGGDAFGYSFLEDGTLTGFVIDVSGHGIGSAMHAVTVANTLRRQALPGVDFRDPAAVAAGVNAMFPMEQHNGLMLTLWYFVYDPGTRLLRFCSAGHHPSYMVPPGVELPIPLWLKGPAVGMLPTGIWSTGRAEMAPGTRVYVFSDGAFEIVTHSGEAWSIETLRRIMGAPEQSGTNAPQLLYQTVRAAARGGRLEDDFSVMVLRFP